jgi:hypothetical protein
VGSLLSWTVDTGDRPPTHFSINNRIQEVGHKGVFIQLDLGRIRNSCHIQEFAESRLFVSAATSTK